MVARPEKKAKDEQRTIVFVDEAGFYLLPMAGGAHLCATGTHAILRMKLTRDHLSAIGAITTEGKLLMQTQDHAYDAQEVVRFPRLLLRRIAGKLLMI